MYLNELDQFVKRTLKCRHYLRYVDDMVLLALDQATLVQWCLAVEVFLRERLKLELRPEMRTPFMLRRGFDFVGWKTWWNRRLPRRRTLGNMQSRLERFERVGGLKPLRVEVRIIAATNRDLDRAVKEERFREDLYHRLHVVPITLPSLRERKEDVPGLIDFFLHRFSLETKKRFTEVTEDARKKLLAYDWPGNVRELANVMERAIVLGQEPQVTLHDLPPRIIAAEPRTRSDTFSYRGAMNATKREAVLKALAQTQGNRAAAAKLLGVQRSYILKLIKSLGID